MLKCNIVRDLLPTYIDGLASKETENDINEHLQKCSECNELLKQLKTPIEGIDLEIDNKEINYLKKIKVKNAKKIAIIISTILLSLTVLSYLFLIGSPVESNDMKYETKTVNNELLINFELISGKKLNMKTHSIMDKKSGDLVKVVLEPYEVFSSPICEGTKFMYGYESMMKNDNVKIVIKFKDKEIVVPRNNL